MSNAWGSLMFRWMRVMVVLYDLITQDKLSVEGRMLNLESGGLLCPNEYNEMDRIDILL